MEFQSARKFPRSAARLDVGSGGRSGGASPARGSGRTRDDDVCVSRTPAPTSRREPTQTRANECAQNDARARARSRPLVRHPRRTRAPGARGASDLPPAISPRTPRATRDRARARVGIQRASRPRARSARATPARRARRRGWFFAPLGHTSSPVGARAVFRHRRRAVAGTPTSPDPRTRPRRPHAFPRRLRALLRPPVSPAVSPIPPLPPGAPSRRHTPVHDQERIFQGALGRKEEGEPRRKRVL